MRNGGVEGQLVCLCRNIWSEWMRGRACFAKSTDDFQVALSRE